MDIQKQIYLNNLASAAKQNGTTPQQELYNYAMANGYNASDIDTFMDAAPGTAQGWIDANITNKPQSAPQLPYNGPPNPVNSPPTPTTSLPYYGPPNPVNSPATPTNLGMGGVAAPQGNIRAQPSGNQGYGINNGITNNDRPTTGGFNTDDSFYGLAQPPGNQPAWGNQSNLGMGDSGYQRNPYLDQASRDIGSQMFDTWSRQIAPSIRSNAMAAGGYGGSRQGVVEANALNDMQRNYGQALTSMYGQDYTNFQNRGITRQGQAQSYDLGLRNNDTANWSLDAGINQNNFNNNLASANFGLGVQNQLMNNNGVGIAAGTNIQNTPFDYQKYLNTAGVQAGGAGDTRTGTTTS